MKLGQPLDKLEKISKAGFINRLLGKNNASMEVGDDVALQKSQGVWSDRFHAENGMPSKHERF